MRGLQTISSNLLVAACYRHLQELRLGKEAGMYRCDEKIAVASDRDLGDAPITFDERAIDRAARDRQGFPRDRPPARLCPTQRAEAAGRAPGASRGLVRSSAPGSAAGQLAGGNLAPCPGLRLVERGGGCAGQDRVGAGEAGPHGCAFVVAVVEVCLGLLASRSAAW